MKFGDQFHDTLHNTRVRREIAANERREFVEKARQDLILLLGRYESTAGPEAPGKADAASAVQKARERLLEYHQNAQAAVERIVEADEDDWYGIRDEYLGWLELLRQELHTFESLIS